MHQNVNVYSLALVLLCFGDCFTHPRHLLWYNNNKIILWGNCPKIWYTKISDKMTHASSADPDQTAPEGAFWSGSTPIAVPLSVLTLKMPRKPASENVACLCWIFLQTFQTYYCILTNSVDLDQIAPSGAVWSWSTLFARMSFKITSIWQSRQQLLWLAV